MRILVVSNFYPPYYIGGYELGCYDIVQALAARGHELTVLTSTYGVQQPERDGRVFRWLTLDPAIHLQTHRQKREGKFQWEWKSQRVVQNLLQISKFEIVYFWNFKHLAPSLISVLQASDVSTAFFIFDYWLEEFEPDSDGWFSFWQREPDRLHARMAKPILKEAIKLFGVRTSTTEPQFRYVHFASHYLKEKTLRRKVIQDAEVIYWGLDTNVFPFGERPRQSANLLYAGQLMPHKGVHTAIEAVAKLKKEFPYQNIRLDIVGGTMLPEYVQKLHNLVRDNNLEETVTFLGARSRQELAKCYQAHDILVFPSAWDEPFGITLLEAMSSGLAVVGTSTGGSAEILSHEYNALIFNREDVQGCANAISRLFENTELFERIRHNGRRTVEERFTLDSTIDRIEAALHKALEKREQFRQPTIK